MKHLLLILSFLLPLSAHFDDEDLYNFEKRCMVCHDTYVQNEMAPPIIAINQRYKKYYGDMDLSISKIKDFLISPSHEKAIMQPAIKLYSLMPKQELNKKELEAFPEIIMLLDYDVPEWFDEHYKSHNLKD
ncbi:MAG: hypothetical protein CL623_06645 [Arcobacter sp.]|nr:hypothetical protein [Arcobacter sp.]|tara:strand:+ start:14613 stop:15005 length:393 start_codon:yes stop_codon:yes gene_type:complete